MKTDKQIFLTTLPWGFKCRAGGGDGIVKCMSGTGKKYCFLYCSCNFSCTFSKRKQLLHITYSCKFQGEMHALCICLYAYATYAIHTTWKPTYMTKNVRLQHRCRCSRGWGGSCIWLCSSPACYGHGRASLHASQPVPWRSTGHHLSWDPPGSTALTALGFMLQLFRHYCSDTLQLQTLLPFCFQPSAHLLLFCSASSVYVPAEHVALLSKG